MLTDPIDSRNDSTSLLKSRYYDWMAKDLRPIVSCYEDRHLELHQDSVRLKTDSPTGKRYAY